jgi:hypothetical protein
LKRVWVLDGDVIPNRETPGFLCFLAEISGQYRLVADSRVEAYEQSRLLYLQLIQLSDEFLNSVVPHSK